MFFPDTLYFVHIYGESARVILAHFCAAEQVVASFDHPYVKVCPLHLASAQTKQTARKSKGMHFLQLLSVLAL